MIALVLSAVWLVGGMRVAVGIGRAIRMAEQPELQPEPDWLWDQPTDALSDAAVDARFWEITAPLRNRARS